MAFLSELATNASRNHVAVLVYSGNDDALVSHFSTEGTPVRHQLFRALNLSYGRRSGHPGALAA